MTTQKSFKRLVRARMEKTGQSYTTARAALLNVEQPPQPARSAQAVEAPVFTVSDEIIRRRTGRGWEEWLDLLDAWGAVARRHGEIARWVAEAHGADGWSSQAITVSYERARGLRAVGEQRDGFTVTATKTIAAPVQRLYEAVAEEELRARWLPGAQLRERTATPPRSARYDWGDGSTRLVASFIAKGEAKSAIAISHEKIPDAAEAERLKAYWRERVVALKQMLERA